MIVSGGITIYAIRDAEFSRIQLSTDTIIVDPYNVQTEPLVIKVELVSGANVSSASAYISTQAVSIGKPISGTVKDFGLCSKAEFTIPAKDKLYATATAIRVDSYSDAGKKNLIESKTVNVVCNQIPEPLYRGEKWASGMSFRNGDFLEYEVNGSKSIYQWSSRVDGNTSKAPWDIKLTTDPEYGYWEHVTEKTLFAAKVLLAKSALVGSAVFNGDYMLSQQGKAIKDGATYKDFTPNMDKFVPNIVLNYLTGYAHFAGKKVIFKENGDVEITGNLKSGSIGSFVIDKGLSNVKGDNIIDDGAFIHMEGKNCRFDLNSPGTEGLCDIRADGGSSTQKAIAQLLQTYGKHSIALKIRCNAGGDNSSYAIESHGNVLLKARSGEKINAERFCAKGLNVGTKSYEASGTVPDNVDLIRTNAGGTHTLTLPTPGSCTGKIYYLKNTSGTWVLHNGPFLPGNGWRQQDTYTVDGTQALQLISDGGNWCVFNGW